MTIFKNSRKNEQRRVISVGKELVSSLIIENIKEPIHVCNDILTKRHISFQRTMIQSGHTNVIFVINDFLKQEN